MDERNLSREEAAEGQDSMGANGVHERNGDVGMGRGAGSEGLLGAEADADFIFQVVILGDSKVGKTSLLKSMVAGAGGAGSGRGAGEGGGGGEKVARMSQRLAYASVAVCAGTSPPQQWAARSSLQTARAMNGGAQTARPLADPHTVKLRLWDFTMDNTPSGAEDSQLHTLLRHADAVCLVYDITRHTFSKVLSL